MATKVDEILSLSRRFLQDTRSPFRNDDDTLVDWYNHALFEVKRFRPDLLIPDDGAVTKIAAADIATTDFQLDEAYALPVAQFIASMTDLTDDEFSTSGRAVIFLQVFRNALTGE